MSKAYRIPHGQEKNIADIKMQLVTETSEGFKVLDPDYKPGKPITATDKSSTPEKGDEVVAKSKRKKKVKQPTEQILERVGKSADKVKVTIGGSFGKITQPFSLAFKTGWLVILAVDKRKLDTYYELPDPGPEPMPVTVDWGAGVYNCWWAGIMFTMPDESVTFSVLFVQED